ncbi:hypothetical protein ACI68E_003325 [Malassezia pachydermatis]
MSMMGWSPGTGLGTTNKGMTTNITVAMKLDNKGIGAQRHEREALAQGKADAWIGAGGDLGSLFDRLNQANDTSDSKDTPTTSTAAVTAVAAVSEPRPVFSRLAHRAKFRRAKQMVGTNAMSMNEILGIKQGESSDIGSPAISTPVSTTTSSAEESDSESDDLSERKSKKKEKKKSKEKTKSKDKKKKDKGDKSKKKDKKKSKKDAAVVSSKRKRDANEEEETAIHLEEESNVIMNTSGQYVFQYLSNKLIRKKAEIAQRKREQGIWWGS